MNLKEAKDHPQDLDPTKFHQDPDPEADQGPEEVTKEAERVTEKEHQEPKVLITSTNPSSKDPKVSTRETAEMKSPQEADPSQGTDPGMQIESHWGEEGPDQCPTHLSRLVPPTGQYLMVLGLEVKYLSGTDWGRGRDREADQLGARSNMCQ